MTPKKSSTDLVEFLDFDNAKDFLKENATKEEWDKTITPNTQEAIKSKILDYMPFAWEKANGMRGISANRSIDHMTAWLWLYDDNLLEKVEEIEYEHYGKEKLIAICEHFNWDWKQWDDGIRTNG